ncbi:hypothetical protein ACQEU5_18085 [Marinactinospora thermotolerans]|nr:hypothetical protein [Marinactinospora thermotolerans]
MVRRGSMARGAALYGQRVPLRVDDENENHALLYYAACTRCRAMMSTEPDILAACWRCGHPQPADRRRQATVERRVQWRLLEEVETETAQGRPAPEWACVSCGRFNPLPDATCANCKRTKRLAHSGPAQQR